MVRVFTVGHSDRTLEEFLELLGAHGVEQVVDVRKLPGSRRHPQFNQEALIDSLGRVGVSYCRIEALTGRRPVSRTVNADVNGFWINRSFHNYADWALCRDFQGGLDELRKLAAGRRTAIMCSEAVWWRCHRRLIADHLLAHGDEVFHIMTKDRAEPADLTEGAVVHDAQSVTYPSVLV